MKIIFNFFNLILSKVLFLIVILIFILTVIPNNLCNSKICHNIDIRNSVENFDRLNDCTIVTGYLQVVLIQTTSESDYKGLRFDSLREISGFLLVHQVDGLKSLGQLFPNLVVIRGIHLFAEKYALVIYDNYNMQEIGLKSLLQVQRGFVRIQQNPRLCYSDTIQWENITTVDEPNIIDPVNAAKCPNILTCRGCEPLACWSNKNCQRFDTPYNRTGNIKCHPNCLGGCKDITDKGCFVCRNITSDDGRCVDKCEPPRILNIDNYHCQHALCKSNCTCQGIELYSLENARQLQGCSIINGSLKLRISTDVPDMDLLHDLELYLGKIEEITDVLKIYRSIALTTLSFFKNLRVIHGRKLERGKYGLVIYDNLNLKTLWNWEQKSELSILNGSMSIHYNNKLCLTEIRKLQEITKYSNASDFVCRATNGNKQSCNNVDIVGQILMANSENVTVAWEKFISQDPNYKLIGYIISYIDTPRTNITLQYGRDVCSKFSWQTILVTVDTLVTNKALYEYTVTNLKPYTHYGLYVKSFSAEDVNMTIYGQTPILYFTTLSAPPGIPIVDTSSKTSNSLQIRWVTNENDTIEDFKISVLYHIDDIDFLDQRDYCKDSQINETVEISTHQSLDLLPCCMEEGENIPYEELVEIGLSYQTGSPPTCFDTPTAECHHLPYAPNQLPQSDSYYNYNNYYHNIDYEFRDSMFEHIGLKNLRSSIEDKRIIRNYTLKSVHRDYNITNLRPFGMYTFLVIACNKYNQCSPFYMHTDRTAPLRSNDDINFESTQTSDSIILYFAPPPNPNGITIAFHIDCMIISGALKQEGTLCVTRKDHEMNNFTFGFEDLPNGSYAIRVRSLSLAGAGNFSDWKLFDVNENVSDMTLQHTLTFLFITFLLIIILVLVYKYYLLRHCCKSRSKTADRVDLISTEYTPAEDDMTWHLNYDSDDNEFNGLSGLNRSSIVEDSEPGLKYPFSRSPSSAHTEHERF